MTICNNCKHLWKRCNKFYCNNISNTAYSKSKKECEYFEEGDNVRHYYSKLSNKYKSR